MQSKQRPFLSPSSRRVYLLPLSLLSTSSLFPLHFLAHFLHSRKRNKNTRRNTHPNPHPNTHRNTSFHWSIHAPKPAPKHAPNHELPLVSTRTQTRIEITTPFPDSILASVLLGNSKVQHEYRSSLKIKSNSKQKTKNNYCTRILNSKIVFSDC